MNVKAVQGKEVPLEWTDTSGGLLEWWHDPTGNTECLKDAKTWTHLPGIYSLVMKKEDNVLVNQEC